MTRRLLMTTVFAASTVLVTACALYDGDDETGDDGVSNPPEPPIYDSGPLIDLDGGPCGATWTTCADAAPPEVDAGVPDAAPPPPP